MLLRVIHLVSHTPVEGRTGKHFDAAVPAEAGERDAVFAMGTGQSDAGFHGGPEDGEDLKLPTPPGETRALFYGTLWGILRGVVDDAGGGMGMRRQMNLGRMNCGKCCRSCE